MQRKICLIIIGYIILLCIIGLWFAFQKGNEQLHALEAAVIEEIFPEEGQVSQGAEESDKDDTGSEGKNPGSNLDGETSDYWEEYRAYEKSRNSLPEIKTQDRLRVLHVIKKNLSGEDMRLILTLVKDGITPEEQKEIKDLLRSKLNEEERSELKTIVLKYL